MNSTTNIFRKPPWWRWWNSQSPPFRDIEKRSLHNSPANTSLHPNSDNTTFLHLTTTQLVIVSLFTTIFFLILITVITYTCCCQGSLSQQSSLEKQDEEEKIATNESHTHLLYPPHQRQQQHHLSPLQQQQADQNSIPMTINDCPSNLILLSLPTVTTSRSTTSRFQEHFF